ncbi:MAG: AI-2E family transporter [Planctomycetes bacterium]|nr:AI-2E family transporter [Planctomycetota bacterium]
MSAPFSRAHVFAFFFAIVLACCLYLLYRIFEPFINIAFCAALLAVVFHPLYAAILRLFRERRTLASVAMTLLVVVIVVLPGVYCVGTLVNEMTDAYNYVKESVQTGKAQSWVDKLNSPSVKAWLEKAQALAQEHDTDLRSALLKTLQGMSRVIVAETTSVARNVLVFLLNFLIMLFILFFFFRDGAAMFQKGKDLLPMEAKHKDAVLLRLSETVSAVVRGVLATAVIQGLLAGLGFWMFGVGLPVFLGMLTALLALFPLGGAAAVWVPCCIYLYATGHAIRGTLLLIWGIAVVSSIDNFLKPLLIGGKTALPTLFVFLSILGGIKAYGFLGIFLGPVLLAVFAALVKIYREEYMAEGPVSGGAP